MLRFVANRLLFIILVLFGIVFTAHWGVFIIQPVAGFWESAAIAWDSTLSYLSRAITGDLGTYKVLIRDVDVWELLRQSFAASMGLLLLSGIFSALVGVLLGIFVALTRFRILAFVVLAITLVGISLPSFFSAMLLQNSVIVYYREFDKRLLSVAGTGWDYEHLILPVLVLSIRPIAYLLRITFIALRRTMQEDYIRTAYSKGLKRSKVVSVHALRNVAVPIMAAIGVSWRFTLGVLPVVEYMFAWPGMGFRLLEGLNGLQLTMVVPLAVVFGMVLLLGNLILDIAYRIVDPRLRGET